MNSEERLRTESGVDRRFNRLAHFAPTGEVPCVGKATALNRLHGLNAAIAALQEDAGTIRLVDEGETIAARSEAGELLDKV